MLHTPHIPNRSSANRATLWKKGGKLTEVIERLSPGYLHIYGNEGAMANADVMRSIQLLGEEVIPALHEIQLKPYE